MSVALLMYPLDNLLAMVLLTDIGTLVELEAGMTMTAPTLAQAPATRGDRTLRLLAVVVGTGLDILRAWAFRVGGLCKIRQTRVGSE
jgi:hypothetical protein